MSSIRKLQFSKGSLSWSPVYPCLQTERDLERSPFKEEKVSRPSLLTIYFFRRAGRGDSMSPSSSAEWMGGWGHSSVQSSSGEWERAVIYGASVFHFIIFCLFSFFFFLSFLSFFFCFHFQRTLFIFIIVLCSQEVSRLVDPHGRK